MAMDISNLVNSINASVSSLKVGYFPSFLNSRTSWILATTSGVVTVWLLWRRKRYRLPPAARGLPLLGNILDMSENELHEDLIRIQKRDNLPDEFIITLGPWNQTMILNSQRAIKDAFVTSGEMFANRPFSYSNSFLKDEIIFKDYLDPSWNEGKALIVSLLRTQGFGNTKGTEQKILEQVEDLQTYVDPLVKSRKAVDLHDIMPKVAGNIIFEILFNKRYPLDDPELATRVQIIKDWYLGSKDALNIDLFPAWIGKVFFRKEFQEFFDRTDKIREFVRAEIKEHLQNIDSENPRDFLEGYLSKKNSQDDIVALTDTVFTFLPDSVDTIGVTMNWVFLYLAHNQDIQQRAYEEIIKLTDGTQHVTLSHRQKLPLCEAVMLETMRVAVPIPFTLLHAALKDSDYKGYRIPKSLPILANLYAALKDPEIFKNPDDFNPDRFLDTEGKLVRTDTWIQFGMGRRKCLGEQIAKVEIFLVFTNLLQRYKFTIDSSGPVPSLEAINTGFSRVPKPFKLLLEPRN